MLHYHSKHSKRLPLIMAWQKRIKWLCQLPKLNRKRKRAIMSLYRMMSNVIVFLFGVTLKMYIVIFKIKKKVKLNRFYNNKKSRHNYVIWTCIKHHVLHCFGFQSPRWFLRFFWLRNLSSLFMECRWFFSNAVDRLCSKEYLRSLSTR